MKNTIKDFEIPFDCEELKDLSKCVLPEPDLLDYYSRLSRREILVNQDIDEDVIDYVMMILKWNREDKDIPVSERKKIKVFVNSDGGCLNSIMAFNAAIEMSKTPVITIGLGKVYSSGGLLLMAGHTRYILTSTTCLIHDGYTGAIDSIGKFIDNAEFTKRLEKKVRDYILRRTKITPKLLDKNYRMDWWLFADEMVEYGIADKIVTDIDEIV